MGVPQIIHFDRMFHYKPSILGYLQYPHSGKPHLLNGIHFAESFGRLEYIRMIDNHGTEVKADASRYVELM